MSCLENLNIPSFVWFEGGNKQNSIVAIVSGILFSLGWWMIIDGASTYPGSVKTVYYMCGIVGTLSLIMVNSVSYATIRGDLYEGGCMGARAAKIFLFLAFVMGFVSVIAAFGILVAHFVHNSSSKQIWPGVALVLQNILIIVASFTYKFGRSEDVYS